MPGLSTSDLTIREPKQKRSREAWARVLDAGVELIERTGYEGFTIAALTEASGINPRAVYDRVNNKDALFLAVYEHKMATMWGAEERLFDRTTEPGLQVYDIIERAVAAVLVVFEENAAFLRAVLAVGSYDPIIFERGRQETARIGERFTQALSAAGVLDPADSATASFVYRVVYSTAVLRTLRGPDFIAPANTLTQETTMLAHMVDRYLRGR